jgi:flagellar biosynthetic protein FlhB
MAEESQDGQEKTEEPSQRKLDKAREDGKVVTSKEMFVFTSLAAGLINGLAIMAFGAPAAGELGRFVHARFENAY